MDVGKNDKGINAARILGDFLYLVGYAANDVAPDAGRVACMDLDAVYLSTRCHILSSTCDMAIKTAAWRIPRTRRLAGRPYARSRPWTSSARLFFELDETGN